MEQVYGKGTLVPTGKHAPALTVNYQIGKQMVEIKEASGSFLRPRAIVHSISCEAGEMIGLGDFDLLINGQVVRLKHVANQPEWLVLSSNASSVCV